MPLRSAFAIHLSLAEGGGWTEPPPLQELLEQTPKCWPLGKALGIPRHRDDMHKKWLETCSKSVRKVVTTKIICFGGSFHFSRACSRTCSRTFRARFPHLSSALFAAKSNMIVGALAQNPPAESPWFPLVSQWPRNGLQTVSERSHNGLPVVSQWSPSSTGLPNGFPKFPSKVFKLYLQGSPCGHPMVSQWSPHGLPMSRNSLRAASQ